jgi:two-component system chemotaxis sensor kinase CheA
VQGADVLRLRDRLLPVVRLADLLGLRQASSSTESKGGDGCTVLQVLVLKVGAQRYGLVVDSVHDSEEIVVKPLPSFLKDAACYSGATILGDGHVAMILDALGIASFAKLDFSGIDAENERIAAIHSTLESSESQTILLFRNHPDDLMAIHLALVSRIERVDRTQLQTIGGKDYLRYPDRTLRLVHLHEVLPIRAPDGDPEELFVIIPKLVKHPIGIVATSCENVIDVQVEVDHENIRGSGILGSAVIDDEVAVFVDIYGLFEVAEPEIFHDSLALENPIEGARVLIAEDTPFFQAVERSYLTSLGASVRLAADGAEAWDVLNEPDAVFDLLLTDIEMPEMDGLELIRRVRASKRHRNLPIVALTALSNDEIREKCFDIGVTGFETKLDKERLGGVLNQILRGRRAHV